MKPGQLAKPSIELERDSFSESQVPMCVLFFSSFRDRSLSCSFSFNPHENISLAKQRKLLPIYESRNNILYCVENFQTVILVGETGCGKTTRMLPLDLVA